jgi:hypothetical protein
MPNKATAMATLVMRGISFKLSRFERKTYEWRNMCNHLAEVAHQRNAPNVQVGGRRYPPRQTHDDETVGPAGAPTAQRHQDKKAGHSNGRGGRIEIQIEETGGEMAQSARQADLRRAGKPQQVADLAGGDEQAHGGGVSDDDRARDELRGLAQPQQSSGQLGQTDQTAD